MNRPHTYFNAECIKCKSIKKEMVRVGVIIMCSDCFEHKFKTDDPVSKERKIYLHWLNEYYVSNQFF